MSYSQPKQVLKRLLADAFDLFSNMILEDVIIFIA